MTVYLENDFEPHSMRMNQPGFFLLLKPITSLGKHMHLIQLHQVNTILPSFCNKETKLELV